MCQMTRDNTGKTCTTADIKRHGRFVLAIPSKRMASHDTINIIVVKDVKDSDDGEPYEEQWVLQWHRNSKARTLKELITQKYTEDLGITVCATVDIAEVDANGKLFHYPGKTKWDKNLHDRVFKLFVHQDRYAGLHNHSRKRKRESDLT
jgi:hypothetical protein